MMGAVNPIVWPFLEDDVKDILTRTECVKSLVVIAVQMDHLKVLLYLPT